MIITANVGANTKITLPFAGDYNLTVDWGDNSVEKIYNSPAVVTYTYPSTFTTTAVTITINGTARKFTNAAAWTVANGVGAITGVTSWGSLRLTNLAGAFWGCANLKDVPDNIPLYASDTSSMFISCGNFTGYAGGTNTGVDSPISKWDVSYVETMKSMFQNATKFNAPLNNWNTSRVKNMANMFYESYASTTFNQPLNNWNTSKVETMASMFYNCSAFNQPLNNWNTSGVKDMTYMFYNCSNFNQSLNTTTIITSNGGDTATGTGGDTATGTGGDTATGTGGDTATGT
jgi:surface protein